MKKIESGIFISLLIIGAITLFKVFTFDSHLKEAKIGLMNVKSELESAGTLTQNAKEEIISLKKSIGVYDHKNKSLQASIDSILLVKKLKSPKDWDERQRLRGEMKRLSEILSHLREKSKQFE
ncbi:hypothetical protein [Neolewinella persica]|uniref:hypothetical protein n=1 Tax=Neolewinella persica TaxID=70998 RepID=UPI00036F7AFB|nr:hypothetical protein [Neolewinella persica]